MHILSLKVAAEKRMAWQQRLPNIILWFNFVLDQVKTGLTSFIGNSYTTWLVDYVSSCMALATSMSREQAAFQARP